MVKKVKTWISNLLLKHLLNAVTEEMFLTVKFTNPDKTAGDIFIGGKKVGVGKLKNLAQEARTVLQMEIWKDMTNSLKWTANEMLFNKSTSVDDMIAGKMVLYTLDVMQKKLENVGSIMEYASNPQ